MGNTKNSIARGDTNRVQSNHIIHSVWYNKEIGEKEKYASLSYAQLLTFHFPIGAERAVGGDQPSGYGTDITSPSFTPPVGTVTVRLFPSTSTSSL